MDGDAPILVGNLPGSSPLNSSRALRIFRHDGVFDALLRLTSFRAGRDVLPSLVIFCFCCGAHRRVQLLGQAMRGNQLA